ENWPVLKKETLRQNPRAFVADDCNIRKMYEEHTSGSTGKPLSLWLSRETVQKWYALFEARWRRWYGLSRFDRWAILGGQLVVPYSQKKPPFWVWNWAFHQLYMSSYHLSPDQIPFYLEALKRFRIKYIYAYTSSVYALAQEILRQERTDIKMVVILTNAEPLYEYQRQAIEKAFQCPVRETYGMSEIVADASECRNGGLHLWPEVGMVEILEEGLSVKPGKVGELICTGLLNADMPLIRYQVGDRGALSPENFCTCRRTLPKLKMIEGRIDDLLFTADGRKVGRLDPVFKANLPIKEAQIIQESLDVLTVRYIPAPGFSSKSKRIIARRLQERMGGVKVIFEEVDYLPRDSNGKFRAVVCKLPQEQIRSLRVSLT
ncbi:MAG: phenylacetate--CoA ligase family protein, partial [Calditrichaeota bacterium]